MKIGTLQKIINLFQESFKALEVTVSSKKVEYMTILVHKAMTGQGRNFHTPDHIFNMTDSGNPILSLAALFHDVVYYQVDMGFLPEIEALIAPYIQEKEEKIFVGIAPDDRSIRRTLAVFGFEAGQQLSPFAGMNEFLSALVMNKVLEGILLEKELLKISTCIEATIPFRMPNDRGQNPFVLLEERLKQINEDERLSMSQAEIEDIVRLAVVLANKDLENFSVLGLFLDNTWKLLPETNMSLRLKAAYSIKDYRTAMEKMRNFFVYLKASQVFFQYKGVPPDKEFRQMLEQAETNINIAQSYLGVKLLAMAILEALAEMTGGDAPIALFMGDIKTEYEDSTRLENFLPPVKISESVEQSSPIFKLLAIGRNNESNFDIKDSPLSLFLYKSLGPDQVKPLLDRAREMFDGKLQPDRFLSMLPAQILSAIAKAASSMVVTRRDALLRCAQVL